MRLSDSWKENLAPLKPIVQEAWDKVQLEKSAGKYIYPPSEQVFAAFNMDFDDVKVVIIGQDPYHGLNQANGLAFSVTRGQRLPPSLQNIYQELRDDLKIKTPFHGDLTPWVNEGVLLLNTTLTVEAGKPASHKKFGWERFTAAVVEMISEKKENVAFILWGKHAQGLAKYINSDKHLIVESPHPSPFSARNGFFWFKTF
jgi:uracil-DNA glycosylase